MQQRNCETLQHRGCEKGNTKTEDCCSSGPAVDGPALALKICKAHKLITRIVKGECNAAISQGHFKCISAMIRVLKI